MKSETRMNSKRNRSDIGANLNRRETENASPSLPISLKAGLTVIIANKGFNGPVNAMTRLCMCVDGFQRLYSVLDRAGLSASCLRSPCLVGGH